MSESNVHVPITIHEDDAVRMNSSRRCTMRGISMPELRDKKSVMAALVYDKKSIMKRRTLDESLGSTYGTHESEGSGTSSGGERSIRFDKLLTREYGRTVGDNPSCTSGPPVT